MIYCNEITVREAIELCANERTSTRIIIGCVVIFETIKMDVNKK